MSITRTYDYKFDTPICPECGEPVAAILEKLEAIAYLTVDGDKADYCGETEIIWDNQIPVEGEEKDTIVLMCYGHHFWKSTFTEDYEEECTPKKSQ